MNVLASEERSGVVICIFESQSRQSSIWDLLLLLASPAPSSIFSPILVNILSLCLALQIPNILRHFLHPPSATFCGIGCKIVSVHFRHNSRCLQRLLRGRFAVFGSNSSIPPCSAFSFFPHIWIIDSHYFPIKSVESLQFLPFSPVNSVDNETLDPLAPQNIADELSTIYLIR